jgi:hypothetical protein
MTHITNMKPVVSHWIVAAGKLKYCISVGYAVDSED